MKKKILTISAIVLGILAILSAILMPENKNVAEKIKETQNEIINELIVSDEVKEESEKTIEDVAENKVLDTTGKVEKVNEEELEQDGIIEQENISYDGDITGNGIELLGAYQGLTYYSQADSRWANQLYTSTNNKSQTMKSSACRTYKWGYHSKLI